MYLLISVCFVLWTDGCFGIKKPQYHAFTQSSEEGKGWNFIHEIKTLLHVVPSKGLLSADDLPELSKIFENSDDEHWSLSLVSRLPLYSSFLAFRLPEVLYYTSQHSPIHPYI